MILDYVTTQAYASTARVLIQSRAGEEERSKVNQEGMEVDEEGGRDNTAGSSSTSHGENHGAERERLRVFSEEEVISIERRRGNVPHHTYGS
jgi:hypothetical protein